MACGCRKRMKKLEEKAPAVANVIRPLHELAMKVLDPEEAPGAGTDHGHGTDTPASGDPSPGATQ